MSALALSALVAAGAAGQPAPGAAGPPPPPRHELYVSLSGQDLVPGGSGASVSLGWIHRPSDRLSTEAALYSQRLAGTRWSFGRLAGTLWPSPRLLLRLEARLGRSEQEGGAVDDYRQLGGALGAVLVPGRLYVEVESQYLDAAPLRGHVLKPAATVYATRNLSVSGAFYASTGADLDVRALHLRLDVHRDTWSPFAGAILGRLAAALDPLPGLGAPSTSHLYAGLRLRLGGQGLILVGDRARTDEQTRLRLSVLWRIGL